MDKGIASAIPFKGTKETVGGMNKHTPQQFFK